ncbi:MAG: type II secretion system protein M [Sterolibacterium sp.]|jgi:type II secretory pathway component PulM|nr:type II secretion system protein M [Sterolibacterium sp.]
MKHLQPLIALWQSRAPRERQFLAALGIFILAALLAQGLWSAHQARLRLHRQIPLLQQQLDTLQQQAAAIRALQSQPLQPPAHAGSLLQTATTLASHTGLTLTSGQLQAEGARQLRLRASLPFDRWLDVVATWQQNAQLRLIQLKLSPEPTSGQVSIDALFALPDPA